MTMEQNQNKPFEVHQILSVDENTAKRKTNDLERFCTLLNDFFADLVKQGFMGLNNITIEMVQSAAVFDPQPIIDAVSDLYEKEESHIKYMGAKHIIVKAKSLAMDDIKNSIAKIKSEYQNHALKFDNPNKNGERWRIQYLTLTDGNVGFDKEAVLRDCTQLVSSKAQADLLNVAKRLYSQILDFNKLCARYGGVGVGSIFDGIMDEPIIGIDQNNKVFFDPKATISMGF